jgi:hypothetical protein
VEALREAPDGDVDISDERYAEHAVAVGIDHMR